MSRQGENDGKLSMLSKSRRGKLVKSPKVGLLTGCRR
jgi:hypothetical protein